jgi:hypothetical protein
VPKEELKNITFGTIMQKFHNGGLMCSSYVFSRFFTTTGVDLVPNVTDKQIILPKDILQNSRNKVDIKAETDHAEKECKLADLIFNDRHEIMSKIIDEENKIISKIGLYSEEREVKTKFEQLLNSDNEVNETYHNIKKLVVIANNKLRKEQNTRFNNMALMLRNGNYDHRIFINNLESLVSSTGIDSNEVIEQVKVYQDGI